MKPPKKTADSYKPWVCFYSTHTHIYICRRQAQLLTLHRVRITDVQWDQPAIICHESERDDEAVIYVSTVYLWTLQLITLYHRQRRLTGFTSPSHSVSLAVCLCHLLHDLLPFCTIISTEITCVICFICRNEQPRLVSANVCKGSQNTWWG